MKAGEVIGVREKSKTISSIESSLSNSSTVFEWMSWNSDRMEGVFVSIPERENIPENIKEQLIVELYSK
jgi:small subunit ribosomal protein S4